MSSRKNAITLASRAAALHCAGAVALLALASCGEPAAVEADGPETLATPGPVTVREVLYRCSSGREIAARYTQGGGQAPRAELLFDGAAYELHAASAASGALYATAEGRSVGHGLRWHTKGTEATLNETLASEPDGSGVPVDTCHEQPESHVEAG